MYYNVLHRKQLHQGRVLDVPIAAFLVDFIAAYLPFTTNRDGSTLPFAVTRIYFFGA
jgi:hypothetical protein